MPGPDVAIIDSGGANIASLQFALQRLGVEARLTTESEVIRQATHVILPGVGAAASAMSRLAALELDEVIRDLSQPVLGICLGLQLLAMDSDEDHVDCLQIVPDTVEKLPVAVAHPVPNMGWCRVSIKAAHPLLDDIPDQSYFYFLHSYALPVRQYTVATAVHAIEFSAIVAKENFYATQFHPERSGSAGSRLLGNFLKSDQ